ncbi:MAG: 3,4-dihydroxy-2-butanone-4-phosphate synthase, partial [Myxococcota bacterium]
ADLVTPGHVFPLRAREGGVLVRTGQTEGSVDLARLAGRQPAGVICEIMKDDGTMARMPDLEVFGRKHGLRIISVADLIQYRLQTETLVRRLDERELVLDRTGTPWRLIRYVMPVEDRAAIALVKGDVTGPKPLLCRVHGGSLIADLFASKPGTGGDALGHAIDRIEREGRGVVLYLAPTSRLHEEKLPSRSPESTVPPATPSAPLGPRASAGGLQGSAQAQQLLRRFGLGAQLLADLGAEKLVLLTNSRRRVVGITGYGLEIVDYERLGDES